MAKLQYTGSAEAGVTFLGRYQVETGSALDVDDENDANLLLQTGNFRVVEDTRAAKTKEETKKSSSASDSSSSKETKKDSK